MREVTISHVSYMQAIKLNDKRIYCTGMSLESHFQWKYVAGWM